MTEFILYLKSIDRKWLATWSLVYFSFLILGIFYPDFIGITIIKMAGLFLCLVYSYRKFHQDHLLIIALGFTFLADILLAINNVSLSGIFVFCFAHFFHIARFGRSSPKSLMVYFTAVILVYFFGILNNVEGIYVICFIYAASLILNVILAKRWYQQDKTEYARCAFYGFLLFLGCDTCVVVSYLSLIAILPSFLYNIANYLAWAFYYPSQILISNSSKTVLQ